MMRFFWLVSLLCAMAATTPLYSVPSYAQDDEEVEDFDEAALNEDEVEDELEEEETSSPKKTAKAASDEEEEEDLESEFDDEEEETPAEKATVAEEEPAEKAEEPKEEATVKSEPVEDLEPAAPAEEPEPEVAQPEPAPEPEPSPEPEPAPQLVQNNDPDLEYEARLYDIYVNYTSTRTPEDQWRGLVGQRQDERYKIQRNDNLWDISQTLFGDGNYWPKIWSLNAGITNPHIIEPGNTIRFLLGDESGPPAFTVSEAELDVSSPIPARAESDGPLTDEPEIPPPSRVYKPVVKKLPPSLPNWQSPEEIAAQFDSSGISYGKRKIVDIADAIPLAAYITETAPDSLGRVTEIETGYNLAAAFQYIYVRMNPGEGDVGNSYLAVFDKGLIKADPSIVKEKFLGMSIEVLGEIQLIEKVKSEKREKEGDVYRALVTKTVSPVQVGSNLIIGKIQAVDLSEKGRKSQIVAQIIGGQFTTSRKLYGPQSFAFLNKGSEDGVAVGQILPIRANRKARDLESNVLANIRSIGWLKIVKTSERFSTAVILRAWDEIVTGDYTGSGDAINLTRDSISTDSGTQTSLLDAIGDDAPEEDSSFEEGGDDFSDDESE